MQTGVIVVKNPGAELPEQFIDIILKNNSTFQGCCAPIVGSKDVMYSKTNVEDKEIIIKASNDVFKEAKLIYCWGNSINKSSDEEDVPPFTLLSTDDGKGGTVPILMALLEGDFSNFEEESSNHSETYNFAFNVLAPKVHLLYRSAKNDLDSVLDVMASEEFQAEIFEDVSSGTVMLVAGATPGAKDGTVLLLDVENEKNKAIYSWGWTSRQFGYLEGSFPAQEEEKKEKKGGLLSMMPNKIVKEDLKASTTLGNEPLQLLVAPPAHMTTKNQRKDFYLKFHGEFPEGGRNVTNPVFVPLIPTFEEKELPVGTLIKRAAGEVFTVLPESTSSTSVGHKADKDTKPVHIASTEPIRSPPIQKFDGEPTISDESIQGFKEVFLKRQGVVDYSGKPIMHPREMQSLESKFEDWAKMNDLPDIRVLAHWGVKDFFALQDYPGQLPVLAINLWNLLILREKELDQLRPKEVVQEQEEKKPASQMAEHPKRAQRL